MQTIFFFFFFFLVTDSQWWYHLSKRACTHYLRDEGELQITMSRHFVGKIFSVPRFGKRRIRMYVVHVGIIGSNPSVTTFFFLFFSSSLLRGRRSAAFGYVHHHHHHREREIRQLLFEPRYNTRRPRLKVKRTQSITAWRHQSHLSLLSRSIYPFHPKLLWM